MFPEKRSSKILAMIYNIFYCFLNTELARTTREAETSDRRMDNPVQVWRRTGNECWGRMHGEIQENP